MALGVLWLHCTRAIGWGAHGIDFPGHFLLALEVEQTSRQHHQPTSRQVALRQRARQLHRLAGQLREVPGRGLPIALRRVDPRQQ
ncbi:MAG TPA: transglutaminase family protein [Acetobacteraceae bacterium]|nr:transglutaminase family protein [Acetobacteraceae bacterium]